jgi:GTP-binding protein
LLSPARRRAGRKRSISIRWAKARAWADLPGYGYAKVPHTLRRQWQELITSYLKSRASLVGVVVIMDARHPLTPLDAQLLDWLGDVRSLVLLSKADKLSRAEQAATLKQVRGTLGASVMLFSSVTRQGVEECRDLLESMARAGR